MLTAVAFWLLAGTSTAAGAEGSQQIVHAGQLLAVPGEAVLRGATIAIERDRIVAVRSGYLEPEAFGWSRKEVALLDLRDSFVLPGLIDLHVHLTSPVSPDGALRVVTESEADLALLGAHFALRTLSAGFTSVLDLGTGRLDHELAIDALKRASARGAVRGPRILTAGSPLSPTGASRTGRYRREVEQVLPPAGVCDGADDCRRAVREQISRGADVINLYNTGSLNDTHITERTFTDEEFRAIVETAHALERIVVADGHTAAGINAALRAGADIIDTAPWPDEESWRLMKDTGATLVPHLYAIDQVVGDTSDSLASGTMHWVPAPILRRLYELKRGAPAARRAYELHIPIALGSDTGVIVHGENAGELVALVKMGMSPSDAIRSATVIAARALRLQSLIGSIKPGKSADLIAVARSPLEDISELTRVRFVMCRGVSLPQARSAASHRWPVPHIDTDIINPRSPVAF